MRYFRKIIIWLFDRYAFDEWIEKQITKQREDFKKRFDLKDDEVEQAMLDRQQEPYREAYYAGMETGYEKAMDDF